jgi:hypothetical protein
VIHAYATGYPIRYDHFGYVQPGRNTGLRRDLLRRAPPAALTRNDPAEAGPQRRPVVPGLPFRISPGRLVAGVVPPLSDTPNRTTLGGTGRCSCWVGRERETGRRPKRGGGTPAGSPRRDPKGTACAPAARRRYLRLAPVDAAQGSGLRRARRTRGGGGSGTYHLRALQSLGRRRAAPVARNCFRRQAYACADPRSGLQAVEQPLWVATRYASVTRLTWRRRRVGRAGRGRPKVLGCARALASARDRSGACSGVWLRPSGAERARLR